MRELLAQRRYRAWEPVPHETEHWFHGVHSPQLPSGAAVLHCARLHSLCSNSGPKQWFSPPLQVRVLKFDIISKKRRTNVNGKTSFFVKIQTGPLSVITTSIFLKFQTGSLSWTTDKSFFNQICVQYARYRLADKPESRFFTSIRTSSLAHWRICSLFTNTGRCRLLTAYHKGKN